MSLPPVYYGTVDATPLFVCTLADAWRWGADRDEVAALLPAVRRCLEWVVEQSAGVRLAALRRPVRPRAGQPGLEGQRRLGAVRRRPARRPADRAVRGAGLRLRGRRPRGRAAGGVRRGAGATGWRTGPPTCAERFRPRLLGGHRPRAATSAIALDGAGAQVDSVTSNMGHLLGTGILDDDRDGAGGRGADRAGHGLAASGCAR